MVLNVLLMWSQGQGCLQASLGLLQVSAFYKHDTQVVLALDVVWINFQYPADRVMNTKCLVMRHERMRQFSLFWLYNFTIPSVAELSLVQVSLVVGVDVPLQDETLDVVRVVAEQLLEGTEGVNRPVGVGQEQGEVEQRAPKVGFKFDRFLEPNLSLENIILICCQHSKIEENLLILRLQLLQLQKSGHG